MKLACEEVVPNLGCDFVATGATTDEAHTAILAHGGENHSNLMAGLSPVEMETKKHEMDQHIRQLLANR